MRFAVAAVLLGTVLLMAVPMLLPMHGPAIAYATSNGGHNDKGGGNGRDPHSSPLNNLWYPFLTFGGLAGLLIYTTKRPKR